MARNATPDVMGALLGRSGAVARKPTQNPESPPAPKPVSKMGVVENPKLNPGAGVGAVTPTQAGTRPEDGESEPRPYSEPASGSSPAPASQSADVDGAPSAQNTQPSAVPPNKSRPKIRTKPTRVKSAVSSLKSQSAIHKGASKYADDDAQGTMSPTKATFSLPEPLLDELEEVWFDLRRGVLTSTRLKTNKSEIVELALRVAFDELNAKGERSAVAKRLMQRYAHDPD